MKIIALLSFYDEPIEDLVACIKSLHEHGVDELVAVDGRYSWFPGDAHLSHPNQHAAVILTCRQFGLGCTLHTPTHEYAGEVEKRTFHFKLALSVAEEGDWFWIIDADEVITTVPDNLKERLEATDHDCADIKALDTVAERANQPNWPARFDVRHLFRAQVIRVVTNHITYVSGDGRLLWGYEGGDRKIEEALDLTDDVLIEHRPDRRSEERLRAKMEGYTRRNASLIERGACENCGEPAVELVPTRWRMTDLGPVADWMEACDACAGKADRVNRRELVRLGVHPDSVTVENRMGRAPAAVGG